MTMPIRNGEKFDIETLVDDVFEHAYTYLANGNGWDFVVETMDRAEVAEIIGKATSKYGARNRVYKAVQPMVAMRKVELAAEGLDKAGIKAAIADNVSALIASVKEGYTA